MKVVFEGRAFRELRQWAETDPKTVKKIFRLIDDIDRDPFHGLGFPEPLKHELAGFGRDRSTRKIDSSMKLPMVSFGLPLARHITIDIKLLILIEFRQCS
jgi:Txe/YoeB family toxin of toxin-antitoxin system